MQRRVGGWGGCEGQGGIEVVGIHGVNVVVDWNIRFICVKMLYSKISKTI